MCPTGILAFVYEPRQECYVGGKGNYYLGTLLWVLEFTGKSHGNLSIRRYG